MHIMIVDGAWKKAKRKREAAFGWILKDMNHVIKSGEGKSSASCALQAEALAMLAGLRGIDRERLPKIAIWSDSEGLIKGLINPVKAHRFIKTIIIDIYRLCIRHLC